MGKKETSCPDLFGLINLVLSKSLTQNNQNILWILQNLAQTNQPEVQRVVFLKILSMNLNKKNIGPLPPSGQQN